MGSGVLFPQVWGGRGLETTRLHLKLKWRKIGSILSLSIGINYFNMDIDGADEYEVIFEDVRKGFQIC